MKQGIRGLVAMTLSMAMCLSVLALGVRAEDFSENVQTATQNHQGTHAVEMEESADESSTETADTALEGAEDAPPSAPAQEEPEETPSSEPAQEEPEDAPSSEPAQEEPEETPSSEPAQNEAEDASAPESSQLDPQEIISGEPEDTSNEPSPQDVESESYHIADGLWSVDAKISTRGEKSYLIFTPVKTAYYELESFSNQHTEIRVMQGSSIIQTGNSGGTGNNFRVRCRLQQEVSYRIEVGYYYGTGTGTITYMISENPENIAYLSSSWSKTINTEQVFRFQPTQTGCYRFYSTDNGDTDARIRIFSQSGNRVLLSDYGGKDNNFDATVKLEKDVTYFILADLWTKYSNGTQFVVHASDKGSPLWTESDMVFLTIPSDETKTVLIHVHDDIQGSYYCSWKSLNDEICYAQWGEWVDNQTLELNLSAYDKGVCAYSISLIDADSQEAYGTITFNVFVSVDSYIDNTITASSVTKTMSSKAQSFSLKASALGGAKLSYTSNNKSVKVSATGKVTIAKNFCGKAKITITADAIGQYRSASKTVTVTVNPPKVKMKASSGEKGTLSIKWTKISGISGYELQVSSGGKVHQYEAKASEKSLQVRGVSSNKTYEVKMRAYKKVAGKKQYGDWTKTKVKAK